MLDDNEIKSFLDCVQKQSSNDDLRAAADNLRKKMLLSDFLKHRLCGVLASGDLPIRLTVSPAGVVDTTPILTELNHDNDKLIVSEIWDWLQQHGLGEAVPAGYTQSACGQGALMMLTKIESQEVPLVFLPAETDVTDCPVSPARVNISGKSYWVLSHSKDDVVADRSRDPDADDDDENDDENDDEESEDEEDES